MMFYPPIWNLLVIWCTSECEEEAAKAYSEYFKMLKKYGKKSSYPKKVRNVTVWGINNENSWIFKGDTKNPLLFSKINGNYYTNPSFDAVIEAAK